MAMGMNNKLKSNYLKKVYVIMRNSIGIFSSSIYECYELCYFHMILVEILSSIVIFTEPARDLTKSVRIPLLCGHTVCYFHYPTN